MRSPGTPDDPAAALLGLSVCDAVREVPAEGAVVTCTVCDDSGILVTADSVSDLRAGRSRPSWCHGCPAGGAWREAGLE